MENQAQMVAQLQGRTSSASVATTTSTTTTTTPTTTPTVVPFKALPQIPYKRKTLDDIIVEFPPHVQTILLGYRDIIEKEVSTIQRYQSKEEELEDFYQPMLDAITQIKNVASETYEKAKFAHLTLANTLKTRILKWVTPLEEEIRYRLEMKVEDRATLELKTKSLYAEQSFVSREAPLQKAFMEHLMQLKQLLQETHKPSPRCYISYAWPSPEYKAQEYWVQPFLSILYDHLTTAGIRVVMDIRDNKPGDSIYQFMGQYHDGNYIILVGTESLLQKHSSVTSHAVKTELSIILDRFEQDHKQYGQSRIYPMLISGTLKTAYPEIYDKYRTVRDARDPGYIGTLKRLIEWCYPARVHELEIQHAQLWQGFYQRFPTLSKTVNAAEEEIAKGYHRRRLDELRQDIQYQINREVEIKGVHTTTTSTSVSHPVPDEATKLALEDSGNKPAQSDAKCSMATDGSQNSLLKIEPETSTLKQTSNEEMEEALGQELLDEALDLQPLSEKELLLKAIKNGDKPKIEQLLQTAPALLSEAISNGLTPLAIAINHNQAEIITLLLERGASLETGHNLYPDAEEYARFWEKPNLATLIQKYKQQSYKKIKLDENEDITYKSSIEYPSKSVGMGFSTISTNVGTNARNNSNTLPANNSPTKPVIQAFVPMPTLGQGDCAFHAGFGKWDAMRELYVCREVVSLRKTVATTIRSAQKGTSLFKAIQEAIQQLLMSGREGGKEIKNLRNTYQQYLT